jgi:hypothetical protein
MSMAVGLEARVPFLDIELVDWGVFARISSQTPRTLHKARRAEACGEVIEPSYRAWREVWFWPAIG